MKFIISQLVFLLLCAFVGKTKNILSTSKLFQKNESIVDKIINSSSPERLPPQEAPPILLEDITDGEVTAEEIKKEVDVSDLLESADQPGIIAKEFHQVPQYQHDWIFIDKETIRVKFNLYFFPTQSTENTSSSSRSLALINTLQYYVFVIRHYKTNKERSLDMNQLARQETPKGRKYFSTTVLLTDLNHKDRYSVCICYYQTNLTAQLPDLLLCQDIINDYSKFGHIRMNPRHEILFIVTQYSIIIALLIVLQILYTLRNRRFAQYVQKHVVQTAHSIRTTLSNVSLVRQSFSSLDTAATEQQNHANQHEPTINEENGPEKNVALSPPDIVVSEPSIPRSSSEEKEPFLKRIPSKNHVHFLLGPGEPSDDDDENLENEGETIATQPPTNREPYSGQSDALLSMAHILDTNKPWLRHPHPPAPV